MADLTGQLLDQYRIIRLLGSGTMGVTYQAQDTASANHLVAVKVIHPQIAAQAGFRGQLARLLPTLTALRHPHVVRLYRAEISEARIYLVTDYLPGGSLHSYFRHYVQLQQLPPVGEALEYCAQVAEALHYAQGQGVTHHDLRPDNILLRPAQPGSRSGHVVGVANFALKHLAQLGPTSTDLPYRAPEMYTGQGSGPRGDLYALGVILYRLCVGRLPFDPRDAAEAQRMHVKQPVPPPRSIRPRLPEGLQQIIMTCLHKDPAARYPDAGTLARDLRRLQQELEHLYMTAPGAPGGGNTLWMSEPLSSLSMPSMPHTQPDVPPEQQGRDRVVVTASGQLTYAVTLERPVTVIGRDATADITLEDNQISRFHARLEKAADGRYQVIDLGSTNGTWIGPHRLMPQQPTRWDMGVPLRLGAFQLFLEVSGQAAQVSSVVAPFTGPPSPAASPVPQPSQPIMPQGTMGTMATGATGDPLPPGTLAMLPQTQPPPPPTPEAPRPLVPGDVPAIPSPVPRPQESYIPPTDFPAVPPARGGVQPWMVGVLIVAVMSCAALALCVLTQLSAISTANEQATATALAALTGTQDAATASAAADLTATANALLNITPTPTETLTPFPTVEVTVTVPTPSAINTPQQVVRAYFDALQARQYEAAWAYLSFNYQFTFYNGSRLAFQNYWSQFSTIRLGSTFIQFQDDSTAAVLIEASYTRDGQPAELEPLPYLILIRDPLSRSWLIDDQRVRP